ncbi:GPI mannosyltransferase 2 [Nematocida minor]|uniref:GPI mannosyltransferase 2 n=1 Tax=Nematocida minor TaxID=1912983 RepID=UPI00221EE44F|nr:GPI mannosyltransferase 2 [Nematocida minor]KAI5191680.1 GPI mannosyltransferase 2 [Nematocida minor]
MIDPLAIWSASRVVSLGSCALSSYFIPHHDYSYSLLGDSSPFLFLVRWDAIFFYKIARDGYITENMTAFFPLYPMLIRALSHCGLSMVSAGAVISNLSFLISSLILFRMTEKYLGRDSAVKACFLFCFSPCSIIYSSLYTESLFSMFVLLSINSVLSQDALSAVWMVLASTVRSNGFILAPVVFLGLAGAYSYLSSAVLSLLPILVFAGIQLYWWVARFPYITTLPYSYIQSKYWEQGFLEFYRHGKNIPNFLVGFPFIILSCCVMGSYLLREKSFLYSLCKQATGHVVRARKNKRSEIKGKEQKENRDRSALGDDILTQKIGQTAAEDGKMQQKKRGSETFPLIRMFLQCVLLFQVFLSIFFIHMNMHFRFVSYNPVIYWELSEIFQKGGIWRLGLFGYVCFGIAYAVLYGAYFPPA